ncbi:MAG TPA: hypothetical protein VGI43_04125 [Mucilaginibacter sp.]
MKPKPLQYFLFIALAVMAWLSSCDDIIEPSISKSQVKLEAPADKDTSSSYTTTFWWDQVNHALSYHLQIVTRTFASPGNLILDTIVTKNKFTFSLNPGSYQWRVIAENGSSQTPYSTPRTLTIEPTSIKQQAVLLALPANNAITNQSKITFQWSSLYGATQYLFQIDTNNFANATSIVSGTVIPGQQINFTFPKAQVYQWRVQAQNDTAQAQWSAVNTITFNNIPPAQVVTTAPTNGQTLSKPVSLQWKAVANAVKYKLYIFQSDSTTLYNSNFPVVVSGTSYSFNLGNSGDKIYWKVSAIDVEGNEGNASVLGNFILQ